MEDVELIDLISQDISSAISSFLSRDDLTDDRKRLYGAALVALAKETAFVGIILSENTDQNWQSWLQKHGRVLSSMVERTASAANLSPVIDELAAARSAKQGGAGESHH